MDIITFEDRLIESVVQFQDIEQLSSNIFNGIIKQARIKKIAFNESVWKSYFESNSLSWEEARSKWPEVINILTTTPDEKKEKYILSILFTKGFLKEINSSEDIDSVISNYMEDIEWLSIYSFINIYYWIPGLCENEEKQINIWKAFIERVKKLLNSLATNGISEEKLYSKKIILTVIDGMNYLKPQLQDKIQNLLQEKIEDTSILQSFITWNRLKDDTVKNNKLKIEGCFHTRRESKFLLIASWLTGIRLIYYVFKIIALFFLGLKKTAQLELHSNSLLLNVSYFFWGKKIKDIKKTLWLKQIREVGLIGKYKYIQLIVGFIAFLLGSVIGVKIFLLGVKSQYVYFILIGLAIIIVSVLIDLGLAFINIKKKKVSFYISTTKGERYYLESIEEDKLNNFYQFLSEYN